MATPNPTPPPDPSPQHQPQPTTLHIKSAARKLPVKRKTPDPDAANPNPNPNQPESGYEIIIDDGEGRGDGLAYGDDENYDDVDVEEDEELEEGDLEGDLVVEELGPAALPASSQPPFKFQRIWSESDEIRFLQGLLACGSQGMAFPRDLNLFFDRFSETMSQPYTRSQLYEKLRRLRKKFRIVSGRVTRGLDPATALTPHDRDLYHLSTHLWHPSYAASSPFSAPSIDNKRRRPNNSARVGSGRPRGGPRGRPRGRPSTADTVSAHPHPPDSSAPSTVPPALLAVPPALVAAPPAEEGENAEVGCSDKKEPLEKKGNGDRSELGHRIAKAILDVFDGSLNEVRMELLNRSYLDHNPVSGTFGDLARMWQEQRLAELDVLARRMKLVLEHAIQG